MVFFSKDSQLVQQLIHSCPDLPVLVCRGEHPVVDQFLFPLQQEFICAC